MAADHYELLGVDPSARHTDVQAAYRRLMRVHHPDVRPGDPVAEEMARRLTAAWSVLGRPSSRAAYDRQRAATRQPSAPAARPAPVAPAYSPEGTAYRRAFDAASLKVGAAVVMLGAVILVSLAR